MGIINQTKKAIGLFLITISLMAILGGVFAEIQPGLKLLPGNNTIKANSGQNYNILFCSDSADATTCVLDITGEVVAAEMADDANYITCNAPDYFADSSGSFISTNKAGSWTVSVDYNGMHSEAGLIVEPLGVEYLVLNSGIGNHIVVAPNTQRQFAALAYDKFGNGILPAPADWNADVGASVIDSNGLFTSQDGNATGAVCANVLGLSGCTTVTVDHWPEVGSNSNQVVDENLLLVFDLNATDADGDPLIFDANLGQMPGASLSSGGHFEWAPGFDQSGDYNLVFSVRDGLLGPVFGSTQITVIDIDMNAPVIYLNGDSNVSVGVYSAYVDANAVSVDAVDGNTIIVAAGVVDTNNLGTYYLSYDANDSQGNSAVTVTRTVNVVDITRPVIVLVGINPQTITVGGTYAELGATATDNYDGNLDANIVIDSNAVNTSVVGDYNVYYDVNDSSGNHAQAIRLVSVAPEVVVQQLSGGGSGALYGGPVTVPHVDSNKPTTQPPMNAPQANPRQPPVTVPNNQAPGLDVSNTSGNGNDSQALAGASPATGLLSFGSPVFSGLISLLALVVLGGVAYFLIGRNGKNNLGR